MTPDDEREVIARASEMREHGTTLVIGPQAMLPATDGFTVHRTVLEPSETVVGGKEVLFVQDGAIDVRSPNAAISLAKGDTMTIPDGLDVRYSSTKGATLFIVRRA